MRRRKAKKIAILPDPKFNDVVVTKFVNNLMYSGKKNLAFKIFYDALEIVDKKLEDQENSKERIEKAIKERAAEIINKTPKILWN